MKVVYGNQVNLLLYVQNTFSMKISYVSLVTKLLDMVLYRLFFSFTAPAKKRKALKCRRNLSESIVFFDASNNLPAAAESTLTAPSAVTLCNDSDQNVAAVEVVKRFHAYCVPSPTKLRKCNKALR